jgi:hypothetical protein
MPPWLLKRRVAANSPSLWPTMFSVTYTVVKDLPLCTLKVTPTKSGVMVERRDQVWMGFLAPPEALAFSIFSSRW